MQEFEARNIAHWWDSSARKRNDHVGRLIVPQREGLSHNVRKDVVHQSPTETVSVSQRIEVRNFNFV
jgi:hypothetical protein